MSVKFFNEQFKSQGDLEVRKERAFRSIANARKGSEAGHDGASLRGSEGRTLAKEPSTLFIDTELYIDASVHHQGRGASGRSGESILIELTNADIQGRAGGHRPRRVVQQVRQRRAL